MPTIPFTSGSWLTAFRSTFSSASRFSTSRVYRPIGTFWPATTSFSFGRFARSKTERIFAGLERGTASTSELVANVRGFSTSPSRKRP